MKKVALLTSFFVFSTIISFCQDIEQTSHWLDNQLFKYYSSNRYGYNLSTKLFQQCESNRIMFIDKYLLIETTNCKDLNNQKSKYYLLDIKSIKSIRITDGTVIHTNPLYSNDPDYLVGEGLEINCDNIIFPKGLDEASKIAHGEIEKPYSISFSVNIHTSNTDVLENNIRNRIIKAFDHLVSLYGGKTANDNLF